ncbi:hypothetical protein [Puniceicoccus vermicola]|uniref:Uncharacterized protein n=1 Tax=Puniceicoccus vermicola TaxID=388746 RepID=A0A7X1E739_9BACT|nr:hypothetical protein [Puniceicoccus vermicola]MBC2603307.1 hypothetical protein [Puniceicoccus vermicola]
MIRGIYLAVFLPVLLVASEPELTDQEKREAFEGRKEAIERRLVDHWKTVPEEKKALINEVLAYNSGRTNELTLVTELMSPDSDPIDQLYPIQSLRIDSRTMPMFETLLRDSSNDTIKTKIIWRVRSEVLSGNLIVRDETSSLLESFLADETVDPDIRRASEITLRQVREMETNGELAIQNLDADVGRVVEIPVTSSESIEGVKDIEEGASPEPVIEESVAIVDPEESQHEAVEVVEESSPAWPWIVGALILLTALGLVLFRKKSSP